MGLTPNPYVGAAPLSMDNHYQNPKAAQYGLGVEREIVKGLSVGVEGLQVKTDHLQRNYNLNLPAPALRSTTVDPAQRPFFGLTSGVARPLSQLGNVTVRESTAPSKYRALSFSARLQKKFTVAGKHQLIVSADVFNVFGFDNVLLGTGTNFVNYCSNVNDPTCGFSGPTNPTFAQVKGPPRQWQLGIRYRF